MSKIEKNTQYKIIFNDAFFINETVLTHLYLPIIGPVSYQIYQWFRAEQILGASNETLNNTHSRILNYLKISLDEFVKAKAVLESFGLIKTYYDDVNDLLIYQITKPLEPTAFLDNVSFKDKLIKAIGKEEYIKTITFISPIVLDGIYNDCSSSVTDLDAYLDDLNQQVHPTPAIAQQEDEPEIIKAYGFSFSLLFSDLLKEKIVLSLGEEEHNLIETYFATKKFTYQDLYTAIKSSLFPSEDKKNVYFLSVINFQSYLQDLLKVDNNQQEDFSIETDFVRDSQIFTNANYDLNKQNEILVCYKKYSFVDFYQLVTKNAPSETIIKTITKEQKKYGFSNEIINMITDFVILETTDLNLRYFQKTCKTINNLNLHDLNAVLNHLRMFKQYKKGNNTYNTNFNKNMSYSKKPLIEDNFTNNNKNVSIEQKDDDSGMYYFRFETFDDDSANKNHH